MVKLDLRPFKDADLPFLLAVYASSRAGEMAMVDWPAEQKQAFLEMQFDAQHRHYQDNYEQARFDVIETDGIACGRLYVDRQPDDIRIIDIALLPEYQGKGIGGQLIKAILVEAAGSGRSVTLHVEQNNPAMAWYKRLGFQHEKDVGVYCFMRWRASGQVEQDVSSAG